jgi:hypothetical protein
MKNKFNAIFLVICLVIVYFSIIGASEQKIKEESYNYSEDFYVQWVMNFDSDWRYGARYEGPQPIGDCDNDGLNELLIGGRDSKLRVFEWDELKQTYLEMYIMHCPNYPNVQSDAGGFAIGDLTGNGENEVGVTWSSAIHKWTGSKYKILDYDPWIFQNGGGSADCYIGDCDNDGENEFIVTGGSWGPIDNVPEVVVFEWNGDRLERSAEWDDPGVRGYVYMPGLGDVDQDGENELVVGSAGKVVVLDWNKNTKEFESTIIETTSGQNPFTGICKDSDMDGIDEIHVGYYTPKISIFEWNGVDYEKKYSKTWLGEGSLIEGLDIGDVDEDGIAEVCAGTHLVHILQWNGTTYVEEAVLPTFGKLAVVAIGDMDNDGKNEINAASVTIDSEEEYMSWIYKYTGTKEKKQINDTSKMGPGRLTVTVKSNSGKNLGGGSIGAWNFNTLMWYDIQPDNLIWGLYKRSDLPAGDYLLRTVVKNYDIQEKEITIVEGEETTYTFNLNSETRNYLNKNSNSKAVQSNLLNFYKLFANKFMNLRILNSIWSTRI